MAKISGILTDGAGQIINDCTIELYAKKTTSKVLTQTQAFKVANNGSYSMNVLPCEYDVSLIINGFPKKRLGTIQVYSDSLDGSLNDFLLNPSESEITPSFLQQVVEERKKAQLAANDARNSASTIDISNFFPYRGYLDNKDISFLGAVNKGVYVQNLDEKALPELHYPIKMAGTLTVLPTYVGGNGCVQIYTTSSSRQFIRNYTGGFNGGTWGPWIEQITTVNASADIVGALPAVKLGNIYNVTSQINFNSNPKIAGIEPIYIVESYINGDSWYNVYSNGFIEQSGVISVNTDVIQEAKWTAINLLKPMKTNNYGVGVDLYARGGPWGWVKFACGSTDFNSFVLFSYTDINPGINLIRWTVRGY
ncbi:hypothetical protein A9G13_01950 [Gilliamella sp. wkB178]|uniref:prophage tail fiber N-terminal domain-containing protein n=1 Tax=Gilliamella sp. wkB178 TaxID=3120259 RepID=UPI00080E6A98|nr:prophage tail fiber N-terminal domain-containing protein [Gilliamella apicola]OCG08847.1 hypothetical protein A9G13_01950 [Gilliamella apicola]